MERKGTTPVDLWESRCMQFLVKRQAQLEVIRGTPDETKRRSEPKILTMRERSLGIQLKKWDKRSRFAPPQENL